MKQLVITLVGILVLIVVGVVVFSGLGKKEQEPPVVEDKFRKGVSYSPYTPTATADFWEKAKQTGEIVRTGGDWLDFGDKGKISQVVVELSRSNNLVPLIEVNFFDQGDGKLLRPLDAGNRQAYIDEAVNFAREFKPPYLGIGVEIDTFYRASLSDFDAFVSLFSEAYDAVKAVSPKTKIFTTFQLERTRGLRGGIFGGKNDTSKNNWDLLDKFPKADLIAFTTYPGFIYKNPGDVPADYYTQIANYTTKPVAFTEIGWASGAAIKGWESSEDEQSQFVGRFFALIAGLQKVEAAVWIHLYEQAGGVGPFVTMALGKSDGTLKPAWTTWVSATR